MRSCACVVLGGLLAASAHGAERAEVRLFLDAGALDESVARAALAEIEARWTDDDAALILDLLRFTRPPPSPSQGDDAWPPPDEEGSGRPGSPRAAEPQARALHPTAAVRQRLLRFLERRTRQRFGTDLKRWRQWVWSRPYDPHPDYALFKASLYAAQVDARMAEFFRPRGPALVRLDEIDWGGVTVDGIPPLDHPKVVAAHEAPWLKDGHTVFGVAIDGAARAYPQRILGWHELVRDRLGSVELTVVYCTLCGTVIPYGSVAGGRLFTLGTSGLLYRSNKLMYDRETLSLWSTVEGRPVLGPLAGSGLELTAHPVVTTTWGEWRQAHPETTVLSLETGFDRDYSEGTAYRDYFASDALMFTVPREDGRLRRKDEVLAALLPGTDGRGAQPLAVSAALLAKRPVFPLTVAGRALVVLTTRRGANRLYDSEGAAFRRLVPEGVEDAQGRVWRIEEDALVLKSDVSTRRARLPARRAFWFGWQAQYPGTELLR